MNANEQGFSSQQRLGLFLKDVPATLQTKLIEIYSGDYDMFGYMKNKPTK